MSEGNFVSCSIAEILQSFRAGTLTPVDVANWCIDAYQRHEPQCHAWECFEPQKLREAAQLVAARLAKGEPIRPLEGIPIAVKDIFNTTEFPTQMGSPLWKDFTPGNDARALFNLKREGALVPGKTVTAEFAVHSLGKTINPYAHDRTPGTSSSGSAVAVATAMTPAALGTQTAGSIIRPASFCGVWGCKPSFGLIPRTGMLKTTDTLDTVGFFTGHSVDLSRLFEALRVHGRNFPISDAALNDVERQDAPKQRPWRVGVVHPHHIWNHAPGYARTALADWGAKLGSHARFNVSKVELPAQMEQSHRVHETIYNRALAYYFKEEFARAELVSPVMHRLVAAGQKITNAQYEAALEEQTVLARLMDQFFANYDVLVTLSTAGHAPMRDQEEDPDSALIWTLAHLAAVSAPAFTSPAGLPFGLQLVARRYNDPLLFKLIAEVVELGLLPPRSFPPLVANE